jgi:epoxyqueuosine reductase
LGNWAHADTVGPLLDRLDDDAALIRGHVAWALGQVRNHAAGAALQRRLAIEADAWVREEITLALSAAGAEAPDAEERGNK